MQNSGSKQYYNALQKYQKDVAVIFKQRRVMCEQITNYNNEKSFLEYKDQKKKNQQSNLNSQTQLQEELRKIVKRESETLPKKQLQKQQSSISNIKFQQPQNQKSQTPLQVPKAITDRNRRIFGGLTKYLKKAGAQLQSKQEKQKSQNAQQILNKVIEKQKKEQQESQYKKKQQLQRMIKKVTDDKKQNQLRLNSAENQLLNFIVKSHYNTIGKFYLTKTQPKVFWKSKKQMTDSDKLQKIKSYGQKVLKKQEEEYRNIISNYNQLFDHGKFMTQNQLQFCANYIKVMYVNHKNFILTKAEPQIFWKPKIFNQSFLKLKDESCKQLDQKRNDYQVLSKQYYKSGMNKLIQKHNDHQFQLQNQQEQDKFQSIHYQKQE